MSYLVANPKDRFSRDEAHMISVWNLSDYLPEIYDGDLSRIDDLSY